MKNKLELNIEEVKFLIEALEELDEELSNQGKGTLWSEQHDIYEKLIKFRDGE